jgi:hypothetical protein
VREASWTAVALHRFDGRDGDGSKALNAAGIFSPKEPNFQNLIGAASSGFNVESDADWLAVEKRQGAGAVQDAGANFCGLRDRKASWTAVALHRFDGRDGAWSRSFNAVGIFRQTNF